METRIAEMTEAEASPTTFLTDKKSLKQSLRRIEGKKGIETSNKRDTKKPQTHTEFWARSEEIANKGKVNKSRTTNGNGGDDATFQENSASRQNSPTKADSPQSFAYPLTSPHVALVNSRSLRLRLRKSQTSVGPTRRSTRTTSEARILKSENDNTKKSSLSVEAKRQKKQRGNRTNRPSIEDSKTTTRFPRTRTHTVNPCLLESPQMNLETEGVRGRHAKGTNRKDQKVQFGKKQYSRKKNCNTVETPSHTKGDAVEVKMSEFSGVSHFSMHDGDGDKLPQEHGKSQGNANTHQNAKEQNELMKSRQPDDRNLRQFQMPPQAKIINSILAAKKNESGHDFGGLIREYHSPILGSKCLINMQDRYRGMDPMSDCFKPVDVFKVVSSLNDKKHKQLSRFEKSSVVLRKDENEETLAKLEKAAKKDRLHLEFLKAMARSQAVHE